jgi:hypothetical protein
MGTPEPTAALHRTPGGGLEPPLGHPKCPGLASYPTPDGVSLGAQLGRHRDRIMPKRHRSVRVACEHTFDQHALAPPIHQAGSRRGDSGRRLMGDGAPAARGEADWEELRDHPEVGRHLEHRHEAPIPHRPLGTAPRPRFTEEQLRDAVAVSRSWAETLRRLGYRTAGGELEDHQEVRGGMGHLHGSL